MIAHLLIKHATPVKHVQKTFRMLIVNVKARSHGCVDKSGRQATHSDPTSGHALRDLKLRRICHNTNCNLCYTS